jgi:hypothetical protein
MCGSPSSPDALAAVAGAALLAGVGVDWDELAAVA